MMFYFDTKPVSRRKNESVIGRAVYITGRTLHDYQKEKDISHPRQDIAWQDILCPANAPPEFADLQALVDAMERAEKRRDARTARQYIASLPREVPKSSHIEMVTAFINKNFTSRGLCAVAAIHEGRDESDAKKNNPHVHILVSSRPLKGQEFSRCKDRVLDSRPHLLTLRRCWADLVNREYERFKRPFRVSPEKLHYIDHVHDHDHDHGYDHDAPARTR